MRTRWIVLAAVAGTALGFAVFLLAVGYQLPWLDIAGLAVAFGVGLVTAFEDYRKRWPAAVSLIAVSPLLMELITTSVWIQNLLMIYAVGGVAVSSLTILLASIPGPRSDHVPIARVLPGRVVR
jgi:hypothetical protein